VDGKTVIALTIPAGDSVTSCGSLADGQYRLTIDSSKITHAGASLDGDGDGRARGDYVFGDTPTDRFFRKYGDQDGNGRVNLFDFAAFRGNFGSLPTGMTPGRHFQRGVILHASGFAERVWIVEGIGDLWPTIPQPPGFA